MAERAFGTPACFIMSREGIDAYLRYERERGTSEVSVRNYGRMAISLFTRLPEDKQITRDRLADWRQSLKAHGYSPQTELNYVKGINRYLDYVGCSEFRFNRGKAKDISGKEFGYLTAIEPTGEKNRKDRVWRCVCRCGNEVSYPATRLLTGNTVSCGCLRKDNLRAVNKYIDGTSIRQSLEEKIHSPHAQSGYIGVMRKNGKWLAYISYKGKKVYLGLYSELDDAVKVRSRGKELVRMDALGLLDFYEELHRDDPEPPDKERIRMDSKASKSEQTSPLKKRARSSNNSSGYSGVYPKHNKWVAKITCKNVTYQLGTYDDIADAIAARKEAETKICEDVIGSEPYCCNYKCVASQERLPHYI